MNILMFGSDETIFSEKGTNNQILNRLVLYLQTLKQSDPNAKIFYLIHTRNPQNEFSVNNSLFIIPIQSNLIQYYPFRAHKFLSKNLLKLKPDVITCQNPFEISILGLLVSRRNHIPLEIQIHLNLFSSYWLNEHPIYNRFRFLLARILLTNANKIRVVSAHLQKNVIERWKIDSSKVFVAPVPVMIQEPSVKPTEVNQIRDQNEKIILYVGRLVRSKNMPGLFKVYENVLEKYCNVIFIIIGDGPEKEFVLQKANEIAPEQIRIIGAIPYSQLANWYKKSDVFILPSLHEGFSRVLVESYQFKLPAVATKCGGPQDIIIDGHTGFLTKVDDIESFSEKTIWLLEHPKEAKAMGLEGYNFVTHQFNPSVLTKRIVSEWERLVNN